MSICVAEVAIGGDLRVHRIALASQLRGIGNPMSAAKAPLLEEAAGTAAVS